MILEAWGSEMEWTEAGGWWYDTKLRDGLGDDAVDLISVGDEGVFVTMLELHEVSSQRMALIEETLGKEYDRRGRRGTP
jgi:hypothetical protein